MGSCYTTFITQSSKDRGREIEYMDSEFHTLLVGECPRVLYRSHLSLHDRVGQISFYISIL
jgi:hypothetical protein